MNRIFKSENFLSKRTKKCFEGWYFKITIKEEIFAFIVGVCKNNDEQHSFIQYIDKNSSHYIRFRYEDFSFCKKDMKILIGDNSFSTEGINLKINENNIQLNCNLIFSQITRLKKTLYAPSAMGPFSYLSFFCSHAIVAMNLKVFGGIMHNGTALCGEGVGYIEKDFGTSFPNNYIWMHGQTLDGKTSLVFALAYPLMFKIKGFICILLHEGKQHNLSLYNFAKLKYIFNNDSFNFNLKKGKVSLNASVNYNNQDFKNLAAPVNNKMDREVFETVTAKLQLDLIINQKKLSIEMPAAFEHYGDF